MILGEYFFYPQRNITLYISQKLSERLVCMSETSNRHFKAIYQIVTQL